MSGGMTSVDKASRLLKQLFRTENADLDFGIYRIMNFKRAEIERFIDKDLIEAAEAEFKEFAKAGAAELEKELNKRKKEINDFVPGTIGEDLVVLKNHDLPKVKEFIGVLEEYRIASVSEEQVQDVFNHVYEFFSRYYEDGDFIPRTRYGGRDKYFMPYNGEEVLLHWATKDMYYVKTGEYFNKYSFKAARFRVTFKLVEAQIEQGNVKGDKRFFILHDEDPVQFDEASDEVEIRFNYRTLTEEEKEKYSKRKTQDDLIDEALTKIGTSLGVSSISGILRPRGEEKSLMRKHLEAYVERNTKDFFIHKDLRGFLSKELEFYLKNEVWDLNMLENTSESQTKLMMAKAKAIRGISTKIIEFLAQIEEFQKKLFEKKKFVLRTDYCITLDLIPEEFYEEIRYNGEQVMEWKKLFNLNEILEGTLFSADNNNVLSSDFLKAHKHLTLDTRHFNSEFKDRLIAQFDEIEDLINGIMIKSENFHALKLISKNYDKKINCVYIDPPYNTGNDEFLYKDNYQHSSWLSMMYDRIILANELMNKDGVLFSHIDENEQFRYKLLLDSIFKPSNYIAPLVWPSRAGRGGTVAKIQIGHEYIECTSKDIEYANIKQIIKDVKTGNYRDEKGEYRRELLRQWGSQAQRREDRPTMFFPIPTPYGVEAYPILPDGSEGRWRFSKKRVMKMLKDGDLDFVKKEDNDEIIVYRKIRVGRKTYSAPSNILDDVGSSADGTKEIQALFGEKVFDTAKPSKLAERIIELVTWQNSQPTFILDFFAGSGTTGHAAIQLNNRDEVKRKYILIEMGEHFDTVLKPRIKKVTYSTDWKDGLPISNKGYSQVFKYIYLEQYEDTLNNIEFIQSDSSIQSRLDRLPDYFLTYMLDYETKDSPTRLALEQFKTPFNYKIKTIHGGEEKEETVDLVETFNYLLGIHINRLRAFKDGDRLYKAVYGTRGNEQVVVIWRDTPDLDLKRDKEFIENTVLLDITPDTVYINGDSFLENASPIEPEFKRLMGA